MKKHISWIIALLLTLIFGCVPLGWPTMSESVRLIFKILTIVSALGLLSVIIYWLKQKNQMWFRWLLILAVIIVIAAGIIYFVYSQVSTTSSIPTPTPTAVPTDTPTPTPTPIGGLQLSHPSPQEIFDKIDNEIPYLQNDLRQSYIGLPVVWAVNYSSIDGGRVTSTAFGEPLDLVIFTINISDYPQLKTMNSGQEFIVQGNITSISTYYVIELSDCHLTFP